MHDGFHVIAGECTTEFSGDRDRGRERRGEVVVLVKPDNTVLVHDAAGYQPVAWLTRPETVSLTGGRLTARDGEQRLDVTTHDAHGDARYPASAAGLPVGQCPDCGGELVRDGGVICLGCRVAYGVPSDAAVLDDACECGLPRIRVERGRAFEVCFDRECESLDERVRAAFDREWDCPACGADLRVRRRGGLLVGCDRYPDCRTGYSFPAGTLAGGCGCGLPRFETGSGERCLDANCGG